ncbi:hypothetical protein GCM10027217_31270 [Pseudomaricurvus hydrocarbonicus]
MAIQSGKGKLKRRHCAPVFMERCTMELGIVELCIVELGIVELCIVELGIVELGIMEHGIHV